MSFEVWIFLQLLSHLRCGISIFLQSTQWVGKLTQWVRKLGILGKNLGVKASPCYIGIRGITGRVLTKLTCSHNNYGQVIFLTEYFRLMLGVFVIIYIFKQMVILQFEIEVVVL